MNQEKPTVVVAGDLCRDIQCRQRIVIKVYRAQNPSEWIRRWRAPDIAREWLTHSHSDCHAIKNFTVRVCIGVHKIRRMYPIESVARAHLTNSFRGLLALRLNPTVPVWQEVCEDLRQDRGKQRAWRYPIG